MTSFSRVIVAGKRVTVLRAQEMGFALQTTGFGKTFRGIFLEPVARGLWPSGFYQAQPIRQIGTR